MLQMKNGIAIFKLSVLWTIALIYFPVVSVAVSAANSSGKKGFYVGIESGASQTDFPTSFNTLNNIAPNEAVGIVTTMSGRLSTVHFFGRLYSGYWFSMTDKILAGIQVGLNVHDYNAAEFGSRKQPFIPPLANIIDNTTTTQIVSNGLGGSILGQLGCVLSPSTVLYFGGGWLISHFKLRTIYSTSPFQTGTPELVVSNARNKSAYILSLGLETWFRPHWAFMIHYLYSNFGNISTRGSQADVRPADFYTGTNKIKLKIHAFLAGLTYHFQKNAISSFTPNSSFMPWLINLGVAINNYKFNLNYNALIRAAIFGDVYTLDYSTTPGVVRLLGEASLERGIITTNNHLFLGADVFVNFSKNSASTSSHGEFTTIPISSAYIANYNARSTVKLKDIEFGFDLEPGILLSSSTLLYLKVGIAFNKARLINDFTTTATTSVDVTMQSSKKLYGIRVGLGIREMLKRGFSVSLVYLQTNYSPRMHLAFSQSVTNGMESSNSNVGLFSQQIMFKIGHTI